MQGHSMRYEFRLFRQCFESEEQQLRVMGDIASITESSETYFIGSPPDHARNIKIRNNGLELKRLVDHRQGLERWQPAGQWTLPVSADTALELLLPDSDGDREHDLPAQLDRRELLAFTARPDIPLYRAEVFKRRFHFVLPACSAEVDQLLINGAAIQSLAVESEDPDAVQDVQAALRIAGRENVSYPRVLSRIMGMSAPPQVNGHG